MTVLDALFAGGSAGQFSSQVPFQRLAHGSISPGRGVDTELLEEFDGSASHPSAEHHIGVLFFYETRHLTRLMTIIEGIVNYLYGLDIPAFQVDQGKKRAAPKMMGYDTFEFITGFN
jgi:hypothetical protein